MQNTKDGFIIFGLDPSCKFYWKRVFNSYKKFNLFLLIGFVISLIMHGYDIYLLGVVLLISLISFLYSCIINKKLLFAVIHDPVTDQIKLSILNFSNSRDFQIGNSKETTINLRKRYRYRYPLDCLIITHNNKIVYSQEEVNGWTSQKFIEIESYFKKI